MKSKNKKQSRAILLAQMQAVITSNQATRGDVVYAAMHLLCSAAMQIAITDPKMVSYIAGQWSKCANEQSAWDHERWFEILSRSDPVRETVRKRLTK